MNFEKSRATIYFRPRRLRSSGEMRDLISETHLNPSMLIQPLFVVEGEERVENVASMDGVCRYSIDKLLQKSIDLYQLGIKCIILFPFIDQSLKDQGGTQAYAKSSLIVRAVEAIKSAIPKMVVMADVALDPYTIHGHDGVLVDGMVDNDATIDILIKQALCLAKSGVDFVAPSDMMDGRIGAIRESLDLNGFSHVGILSYAAKYASSFYGPFRNAIGSDKNLSGASKKTYQMDYRNQKEALWESILDQQEGADILMIKPAGLYLDILYRVSQAVNIPVFAYQVSGEYAMIKNAAVMGLLEYRSAMMESIVSIIRSGARAVVTYGAEDVVKWLRE